MATTFQWRTLLEAKEKNASEEEAVLGGLSFTSGGKSSQVAQI